MSTRKASREEEHAMINTKKRRERSGAIEAIASAERAVLSYGERHGINPGTLIPLANELHALMVRFERATYIAEIGK